MPRQKNSQPRWDQRIDRAKELAEVYPFASEILSFYAEIASFQKSLLAGLKSAGGNGAQPSDFLPFRDSLDLGTQRLGRIGYGGPCPPPGRPHRYFIKLYALDAKTNLSPGATNADLERAKTGHILP